MHLTEDNLRIFGLTDAESKVLLALVEFGSMRVSKLGRKANVPRTTAYSVLLRLKDRGFVKRISKGHFYRFWRVSRLMRIKKLVRAALETFDRDGGGTSGGIVGGIDSREIGITVFRGKREILRAYEQMLTLSKAERVIAIQGNRSAKEALETLDKKYLLSFHEKLKKKGVILEGLNGEYVRTLFERLELPELKSHFGRVIISWLLPDEYMNFGVDLLVMRDTALFVDIKTELVVIVRHKGIVELLSALTHVAQDHGKKFDMNAFLGEVIEKKEHT